MKKRLSMFLTILLGVVLILSTGCKNTKVETESVKESESVRIIENRTSEEDISETIPEEEYYTYMGTTEENQERIRKIIEFHGYYRGSKEDIVEKYLTELEESDAGEGKLWRRIMEYWNYANDEMEVNLEKLPDDLPKDDSMCIMVLGFELNDDGSMQNELIGRLNVALACANQYPNAYVVCTGGGTAANNRNVTEAGLMGDWLIEHGLSKDRLIIEDKSQTTAENAIYSYGILLADYPQVDSIALVSSSYHIAWGALLLEAAFMKTAFEKQTPEVHVISNCAYECFNAKYADVLRFETGGMLQMIGEDGLAMQYYSGAQQAPKE